MVGTAEIKSLAKNIKNKHINSFYENSVLKTFMEVKNEPIVQKIRYKDLPDTEINGYPFASDRNSDGELCFYFLPNSHEICVGTTGSGKTTGCLEPRIRAVSSKKNKPCLFITDPKGEVFERNAKHLESMGYQITLLNFKNVAYSNSWNPMSEIYDLWMRQAEITRDIQHHDKTDDITDYLLQDEPKHYSKENGFWSVERLAFPSLETAQLYQNMIFSDIVSESEDLINQLLHSVIPDELLSKNDPSWMMGAQEIFKGLIYLMLEDALDKRSGFTKDNMNFMTLQEYYNTIRNEVVGSSLNGSMQRIITTVKLKHKSYSDESIKHLKAFFENAPTTTRSYLGIFENAMQQWFNTKLYTICNGNSVCLDNYEEKPFAIFLVTRDYEKSDFAVAGLFVDWVYRQMMLKSERNKGILKRELYFMLDEFGNIPAIRDFENKIATSRSRNIWFHMFVQSYAQIEAVYDSGSKRCSQIIRDNCNAHSFLGSQNFETKSTFSRECGKQIIMTLSSALNPDINQVQEVSLLPVSSLENLAPGQMYLRRTGMPLLVTQFERSYLCSEFQNNNHTSPEEMHIKSIPFISEKYRYQYLMSPFSMDDYSKKNDTRLQVDDIEIIPNFISK